MTDIKRALTVEGNKQINKNKKPKSAVCKHRKLRRIMLPIIIQNSYSLRGLTTAAPSAGQKGQNSLLCVQPRAKTGCDWSVPLPLSRLISKFQVGQDGEWVQPAAHLLSSSVPVDWSRELSSLFYCNEDIMLSLHMSCGPCFTAGSFIMTVGHTWWQTLRRLAFDFICHISAALNPTFVRKRLL